MLDEPAVKHPLHVSDFDVGRWMFGIRRFSECGSIKSTITSKSRSRSRRILAHHAQIVVVPRRRNTFARRVRSRLVCARGNTLLAQLAHMPILFVCHVPELNGVVGF